MLIRLYTIMALVMFCLAGSVMADVPQLISYQGMLTDSLGMPVPDGDVPVTFTIYDKGGFELWSNEGQTVEVENGLFTHLIGSGKKLSADIFTENTELWLGISVESEPELTPRTRIVTVPYAYQALNADTSRSLVTDSLRVGTESNGGVLEIKGDNSGYNTVIRLEEAFGGGGAFTLNHPGAAMGAAATLRVDGDGTGGRLDLYPDPISGGNVSLQSSRNGDVDPYFKMSGSAESFIVDLTKDDDSTVMLPDQSVSSLEMYNEPGAGHAHSTGYSVILPGGENYTLRSRMMDFPSDGYAVVIATAYLVMFHSNGSNSSNWVGVSTDAENVLTEDRYYTQLPSGCPTGYYDFTVTVQAYMDVTEGLNTFYFVGYVNGGSTSVYHRKLTVMFFPSDYSFNFEPSDDKQTSETK